MSYNSLQAQVAKASRGDFSSHRMNSSISFLLRIILLRLSRGICAVAGSMLTLYLVKSSRKEEGGKNEREWRSENDRRRTRRETLSRVLLPTIHDPRSRSSFVNLSPIFLLSPHRSFPLPSFFSYSARYPHCPLERWRSPGWRLAFREKTDSSTSLSVG